MLDPLKPIVDAGVKAGKAVGSVGKAGAKVAWNTGKAAVKTTITVGKAAINTVVSTGKKALGQAIEWGKGAVNFAREKVRQARQLLSTVAEAAACKAKDILEGALKAPRLAFRTGRSLLSAAWRGIKKLFRKPLNIATRWIKAVWRAAKKGTRKTRREAHNHERKIHRVGNRQERKARKKSWGAKVIECLRDVKGCIRKLISKILNAIKKWVGRLWGKARTWFGRIHSKAAGKSGETRKAGVIRGRSARNSAKWWSHKAQNTMRQWRNKALGIIRGAFPDLRKGTGGKTSGKVQTPKFSQSMEEIVRKHAPVVYLHSGEEYGPMNATRYIKQSALKYAKPGRDHVERGKNQIDPRKLGAKIKAGHYKYEGKRTSKDTRPDGSLKSTAGYRGWYLDFQGDRKGDLSQRGTINTRSYYEMARSGGKISITYWFFYAHSVPSVPKLRENAKMSGHEGDWERIVVHLKNGADPTPDVEFHQHNDSKRYNWGQIEPVDTTHPAVYSAKGSHASYPNASDKQPYGDRTDKGREWKTEGSLQAIKAQSWYGFGGAWGEIGCLLATTGPQGPSKDKK